MKHCLYRLSIFTSVLLLAACTSQPVPPTEIVSVTEDIVKSPNDSRDYRYLTLGNGLKVLLISDPRADKSAASLTVYRGSFDDPADRPGLAHFLEHMLFIGTEKYPEPDGYFNFVQSHGGGSNAYTASEHTNYFFDIQPDAFREGLDRFAHFFISPLFDEAYVDREKNAVNSEYKMQIKEDNWRGFAVGKTASNPKHPVSQFNIGTLDTLAGDVHGALLKFFESHYSANQMGLVVLAPEGLDEMQPWIVDLFSQIENRNLENLERDQPLFTKGQLPATLRHDNLKDNYSVSFTFPVDPLARLYRKKPAQYLSNLIGHEGVGSLHSVLNALGWINSLGSGETNVDENHSVMTVTIDLTEAGAAHVPEITGYLFAYLDMLRDEEIQSWIYEEQATVAELAFRFAEKSSAINTVQVKGPVLEHIPAEDLLVGPYLMEEFDGALIRSLLSQLTLDNVLVTIASPGYEGASTEKWFGVSYDLNRGPVEVTEVESAQLGLPQPNPFLPESLELVADDSVRPLPVIETEDTEIFLDTDTEFGVPRAVTHVSLRKPGGLISLSDSSRASLYTMLVQDDLNALAYPALLAGVSYQIAAPPKGFRASIGGYADKQLVLLDEVLKRLVSLDIAQDRFDVMKTELLKDLYNANKNRPYQQAYGRLQNDLVDSSWTPEEMITAIEPLTLEALAGWRDQYFKQTSLQALITGNVVNERAMQLRKLVSQHVSLAAVDSAEPSVAKIVAASETKIDIDHADASMVLYRQDADTGFDARARTAFLTHLIAPQYFSSLRTDQQLGYIVTVVPTVFYEQGGLSFIIQSPVAGPFELKQRTMTFLEGQAVRFASMSEEEFGANKGGLITRITQRDKSVSQRAARYWTDLDRRILTFDSRHQLAAAVSKLSLADMTRYLDEVRAGIESSGLLVYSTGQFGE